MSKGEPGKVIEHWRPRKPGQCEENPQQEIGKGSK
jgi:hypothetical protein